jgi:hypothetical protein
MADRSYSIHFDDIPLEQARRMDRSPDVDSAHYNALKENVQLLGHTAALLTIPAGTSPITMKNRIICVVAEIGMPVQAT